MKLEILLVKADDGIFYRCEESGDKGLHLVKWTKENPFDWPRYHAHIIENRTWNKYERVVNLDTKDVVLVDKESELPKNYAILIGTTVNKYSSIDHFPWWLVLNILEHNGKIQDIHIKFNPLQ